MVMGGVIFLFVTGWKYSSFAMRHMYLGDCGGKKNLANTHTSLANQGCGQQDKNKNVRHFYWSIKLKREFFSCSGLLLGVSTKEDCHGFRKWILFRLQILSDLCSCPARPVGSTLHFVVIYQRYILRSIFNDGLSANAQKDTVVLSWISPVKCYLTGMVWSGQGTISPLSSLHPIYLVCLLFHSKDLILYCYRRNTSIILPG